jgi:hypothetical protein
MAKKKKTLVCFVLDETGSMMGYKQATIDGYNEYVDKLRGEKKFSIMLTRFNSKAIEIGDPEPIKTATKLDDNNYKPDMLTPLYDAIGRTIRKAETIKGYPATLFVVMTDGLENHSKEFTMQGVFKMIEEKQKDNWQFAYLGANQDAYIESEKIGVPKGSTINYGQGKTEETFAAVAGASASYSRGGSVASSNFMAEVDEDELQDEDEGTTWKKPESETP